jgi:iron complex transport system ATP-binding protein
VIEFRDVMVRYRGSDAAAVNGVSFTANSRAVTALVGPNGSGKSTLVRVLLGRQPASAGNVFVDGRDRRTLDQRTFAQRIAVVPQREDPVFPTAVREYVRMGRLPHIGAWSGETVRDRAAVERAIVRTEIEALLGRGTDELSGGEWQRVRVARALAQEAAALVLDEPTTFLDVAHEMSLFELAASLAADGIAVLLVSHQLNLVARFATHMVLLDRGSVVAKGAPNEVMDARVLEPVYRWPLVVIRDAASGAPAVIPLRRSPS